MAEASIPVDLFNPGQVFACLGFLEAADVLFGDAEGAFDSTKSSRIAFRLRAAGTGSPISKVLKFVRDATSISISPSPEIHERDGGKTRFSNGIHPCRLMDSGKLRNALLPIELSDGAHILRFDYWADLDSRRPRLNLWTATNGNSAAVRFSKLHEALRTALETFDESQPDPFNLSAPVAANFRLEMRRNWTGLSAGFSPDKHTEKKAQGSPITVATYPAVELLAALGLGNARPKSNPTSFLQCHYSTWSDWLPPELARAAISGALPNFEARYFVMHLEKSNDGGDLSIASATEEIRK